MSQQKNIDKNKAPQDDWESAAQSLINAKFDAERQLALEQTLAKHGIHRKEKAAKRISLRPVLAIAASVLVLVALGWYFFGPSDSAAQQMALGYLENPHQLVGGSVRGGEATIAQDKAKATEAYNNQQYGTALQFLESIEDQGAGDTDTYFLKGLCLMYQETPDYAAALQGFETVRRLDGNSYTDEINWYAGLCYIMTDQLDTAKSSLEKVAKSASSRKYKDAEMLLKKL